LGQATVLTPVFTGGTGTISGIGAVTSGQGVTVSPTAPTTYTLTVTNPVGSQTSAAVTVQVVAPPAVTAFTASKSPVTTGSVVTLSMAFTGTKATIDGLPGSWTTSPATTTTTVAQTTAYTLRVENAAGAVTTRPLTVEAVAAPAIASFTVSGTTLSAGDPIALKGTFSGGTGSITPGSLAMTSGQAVILTPAGTTTYVLKVTNAAGDDMTAQVNVTVVPLPAIQSFIADDARIQPGGSTHLTAQFTGGEGTLAPQVGLVQSGSPRLVQPAESTTYTLVVKNAAGREVSRSLLVKVGFTLKWVRDIVYLGDKEVAEFDQSGIHVTQVDHLGSPRFRTNGSGVLDSIQKFTPFGETLAGDPARLAKGFTGHEQTDQSKMIYMQARFHLPVWGRFTSPDPARDQHFEETQSWNIYSYVQNNPVIMTDPTGMETLNRQTEEEKRALLAGSDTKDAPAMVKAQTDSLVKAQTDKEKPKAGGAESTGQLLDRKGTEAAVRGDNLAVAGWAATSAAYTVLTPGGDRLSEVNARAQNGEVVPAKDLAKAGGKALVDVALTAVAELAKIQVTFKGGGNLLKVISKELKVGFRIDAAHHGKSAGHMHFGPFKGSWGNW
jgi:RHS repeat-associated protein